MKLFQATPILPEILHPAVELKNYRVMQQVQSIEQLLLAEEVAKLSSHLESTNLRAEEPEPQRNSFNRVSHLQATPHEDDTMAQTDAEIEIVEETLCDMKEENKLLAETNKILRSTLENSTQEVFRILEEMQTKNKKQIADLQDSMKARYEELNKTSNKQIEELRDDLKASNKRYEDLNKTSNKNLEGLRGKLKKSNQHIEQLNNRLKSSNKQVATLTDKLSKSAKTIDQLKTQLSAQANIIKSKLCMRQLIVMTTFVGDIANLKTQLLQWSTDEGLQIETHPNVETMSYTQLFTYFQTSGLPISAEDFNKILYQNPKFAAAAELKRIEATKKK